MAGRKQQDKVKRAKLTGQKAKRVSARSKPKSDVLPFSNVGEVDRAASLMGGTAAAIYGLMRRDIAGAALALAGGYLLYKGMSGHCYAYEAAGISTNKDKYDLTGGYGLVIEEIITINRTPEELYAIFKNYERLPDYFDHLHECRMIGDHRYRCFADGPFGSVQWDANIDTEISNELIAWSTVYGSSAEHTGSIRFTKASRGKHCVMRVTIEYKPPLGFLGHLASRLIGHSPEQYIQKSLQAFKERVEAEVGELGIRN